MTSDILVSFVRCATEYDVILWGDDRTDPWLELPLFGAPCSCRDTTTNHNTNNNRRMTFSLATVLTLWTYRPVWSFHIDCTDYYLRIIITITHWVVVVLILLLLLLPPPFVRAADWRVSIISCVPLSSPPRIPLVWLLKAVVVVIIMRTTTTLRVVIRYVRWYSAGHRGLGRVPWLIY